MTIESIVVWLLVGLIAGWIAGKVVTGTGYGIAGDIVVGIIGAVIAGWLFPKLGVGRIVAQPFINDVISAAIGAIILLLVLRVLKRA